MIVMGIDPGTATTGYGFIKEEKNRIEVLEYGAIRTSSKKRQDERLAEISDQLSDLIARFSPDSVAVEQLFFTSNAKTAIKVGEARGVILLTAAKQGVSVAEYTPLQVKQALTGYGKADKKQIQYMVKMLLKCKETPKPDDAADALAIAICHVNSRKLRALSC
ncbi:MAG: crossover junction endodeoxyribonuclease RuvC [Candidatus Margulisiibacteriota bacterium]